MGGLRMLEVTWAYGLMLAFMSYNGWIAIAIIVGSALGYWAFAHFLSRSA